MTEKKWGVYLNEKLYTFFLSKGQRPPGCPEWLERQQFHLWDERGLLLWNNGLQKIVRLRARDALHLLDELISTDDWISQGVSVGQMLQELILSPSVSRQPEINSPSESKYKFIRWELLRLPSEARPELIEFLQANKAALSEMESQDQKDAKEALGKVYGLIIEFHRQKEARELDFGAREIPWHEQGKFRWACQKGVSEGSIWLSSHQMFWYTCVKRPGFAGTSNHFRYLLEAVEWVEKELIELSDQPESSASQPRIQSRQERDEVQAKLRGKLAGGPYWIETHLLEPKQITYKVIIELDVKPISSKTFDLTNGDTFEYDKVFPSPHKLSSMLNLDLDRFKIEQPVGPRSEWFYITSLTTFYQAATAAEQAQKAWDQSKIPALFREGNILRARYGYLEVETVIPAFLGACETPDKPSEPALSRRDYLEREALNESICFSLNINDYREYLGFSGTRMNDMQILQFMHSKRARSRCLPEEVRRESRVWLAKNDPSFV